MRLDDKSLAQLFVEARTFRAWQPQDIPDAVLRQVIDLMKMGPTANNGLPARVILVKSKAAKERLMPHLSEGNREKTMKAPVCAIIGHDLRFHAHPPKDQAPLTGFDDNPERARMVAFRNGSLQGAYFILAARALGLDVGPMSGFDNAGVDAAFFAGTEVKSNFLCNVGYGDRASLRPRGPRFACDEIATIL